MGISYNHVHFINIYPQASLVGLVQVSATFIAVLIVDKLGRKILLISSALIQSLSIICLGVYFWEKEHSCTDLGVEKDCVTDETLNTIGFLPLVRPPTSLC